MVTIQKGVKLRLYPNVEQMAQLKQACLNTLFVWNQLNGMLQSRYDNMKLDGDTRYAMLSAYDMDRLLIPLKQEYPFLLDSDASALQLVTRDLRQAFQNFFKNPKHFGKPNFKSRKRLFLSYTGKSKSIRVVAKRYIKLPKFGVIKTSKTGLLDNCRIKQYTVYRDATNRWYLSLQVETEVTQFEKTGKTIGIDLGLIDMVATSDGWKSDRFLATDLERRIKHSQRRYSKRRHQATVAIETDKHNKVLNPRTLSDFKNVERARVAKAKLQQKLADKRSDYLHKLSTHLVRNYDVIVIEGLKSKNMMKNHRLAKSIANASWYEFRRMLEYKCKWYDKQLIVVSARYTSQECSNCHHNGGKKDLNIREWTCNNCGSHHDRDVNAAINILNKGLATV